MEPSGVEQIEQLLRLLQQSDASELEVETDRWRLRAKRQVTAVMETLPAVTEPSPEPSPPEPRSEWVRAPLVGFFQSHPKPIQVGDTVRQGEVVGLIKAMGLMNEVQSPVDGHVVEVLVEDGDPVEYGQPLYRVEVESDETPA